MNGTTNNSFIPSLKGRSVLDTSQAKKTPITVLKKVTPMAMRIEFFKAS